MGAHKKKHRKHKRHHRDEIDDDLGDLDDYDLTALVREVDLLQAEAKTSVAPSMAESQSMAGGDVAGKKRLKKAVDEAAGVEEEPVEQAKKRRIKEKQKRDADEEIDRRNAEERKKKATK